MKQCRQNQQQSIYDHGVSVKNHFVKLYNGDLSEFRVPKWFNCYANIIKDKLLPYETCLEYAVFHDCGKPRCSVIGSDGKLHFPDHAIISANIYRSMSENEQVAKLIEMDMDVHVLKTENIYEFASRTEAITLLVMGLAEIHSNAIMFGGIDSTSFKIKWKNIDRKGQKICEILKSSQTTTL